MTIKSQRVLAGMAQRQVAATAAQLDAMAAVVMKKTGAKEVHITQYDIADLNGKYRFSRVPDGEGGFRMTLTEIADMPEARAAGHSKVIIPVG